MPSILRAGVSTFSSSCGDETVETVVVRRAGRFSSEDLHQALFEEAPEPRTLEELKEGMRKYVKLPLAIFDRDLGKLEDTEKL